MQFVNWNIFLKKCQLHPYSVFFKFSYLKIFHGPFIEKRMLLILILFLDKYSSAPHFSYFLHKRMLFFTYQLQHTFVIYRKTYYVTRLTLIIENFFELKLDITSSSEYMLAHFIYHSTIRNVALGNATLALFHDLFHKNVALLYTSLEKL